jgi:DNA-directed RNA polymerase specialized sigma24 family protein
MDEHDERLAERFEGHRARLKSVAYRMLGSTSEAEDAVQEAWLRLSRSGAGGVENLGGWLTTVVARVCLNMLRSRRSRREEALEGAPGEPLRARVPDPIVGRPDGSDPEHEALLADGVGLALLVVLEMLSHAEKTTKFVVETELMRGGCVAILAARPRLGCGSLTRPTARGAAIRTWLPKGLLPWSSSGQSSRP